MNKKIFTLNKLFISIALLSAQPVFAANFNFTPVGTIPTTVTQGQTVSANFSLKNMTNTPRNGYFITGLPATVTQNTTAPNCSNPINLAANATCNLQFDITGAVSASFAICKGNSCTTLGTPLNVSISNTPRLSNLAYITQYSGDPVIKCSVNQTDGSLENCGSAGGGSVIAGIEPQGIVINTDENTAYLTSNVYTNPYAFQCPIDQGTGMLGTCTESTITAPSGTYEPYYGFLALNSVNTFTYLIDSSVGRVLYCPISNNTIQSNCTDTGATTDSDAAGIILNATNTVAYIGNYNSVGVTTCSVNNNVFSACGNKTGDGDVVTFSEPAGVVLNKTGTIVYIADYGNSAVYGCDTTTSTSASIFSSCFVAASVSRAWGITINSTNTYAYVTDYNNTVFVCHIAGNGTFDICTPNTTFNEPVDITLI